MLREPFAAPRRVNRYGAREWGGAFGDLGTLLPYVLAYLALPGMNPVGVLCGFGLALVACGLWYRTPMPVQPMKGIGALAVAQVHAGSSVAITAGMVHGAGLVTALVWLALGASGLAQRLARWVALPVVQGLVLGLAGALLWQGVAMLRTEPLPGLAALALLALATVVARARPRLHGVALASLPLALLLGLTWTAGQQPEAFAALQGLTPALQLPGFAWPAIGANDLLLGSLLLALPQLPLTLGNALLALQAEHKRLFPDRPLSEREVALSTGGINLAGSALGGVPMCHGVGGLAAQVTFGARTGGAAVILGSVLLLLGLVFGGAVSALFTLLPQAVLGAVLCMAALALGDAGLRGLGSRHHRTLLLGTAAISLWHAAAGLAFGLALQHTLAWWTRRRRH